jgi:hypothetical protein
MFNEIGRKGCGLRDASCELRVSSSKFKVQSSKRLLVSGCGFRVQSVLAWIPSVFLQLGSDGIPKCPGYKARFNGKYGQVQSCEPRI